MKTRLISLLGALAAASLIAAGCGDDDDSTSTDSEGPALTKAEFREQANAICADGNEEINAEFEAFAEEHGITERDPPSEAQLAEAAEEFVIPSISAQIEEIAALQPPEEEAEAIDTFIDNAESALEEVEEDPGSLGDDDGGPFTEVNEEAETVGLPACGE